MRATVSADVLEREPERRACSLLGECAIGPGTTDDYKVLAHYHYRDHRVPPAVHQVYRAVHGQRVVGTIVYAAPSLNLGVRNRVFGDRYKIGSGPNSQRARLLNAEVELIMRVVVHPTYRGIGLGRRLIAETLRLRPYRYVEMSAAMGEFNPFAERAGMQRVYVTRPEATERVMAALRSIGVPADEMGHAPSILARLDELRPAIRTRIEKEMVHYATRWIKSRTNRVVNITVEDAAKRIAANALLGTSYFLFENVSRGTACNTDMAVPDAQAECS